MSDVLILVGSESDKSHIEPAFEILTKAGVSFDFHASSAHRAPEKTAELVKGAKDQGVKVIICGAGLSAALPGFAASLTKLPVIGVGGIFNAADAYEKIRAGASLGNFFRQRVDLRFVG